MARAKGGKAAKANRPDAIAFDLIGTTFSLASLDPLVTAAGGDASTAPLWFTRTLADGFALSAAGEYRSFTDVAKSALQAVLPKAKPAARDRVIAGLAALDVFPDSAPAMGRAVMDARLAVVANAGTDTIHALLSKGGLDAFVDTVVSADDVKAWKPRADAYRQAAGGLAVSPDRLALVSVHPWDILGAHDAGLVTGWCNRDKSTFPSTFGRPDVTGATLLDVVEALLALEGVAAPPASG
jgi:2-haloacid dehalogenase